MTALLSFTLRRNSDFFGPDHGETKGLGDLYRASQEGAGTMLRALIEFLGVKSKEGIPPLLVPMTRHDVRLGLDALIGIPAITVAAIGPAKAARLAALHDGISKRTSHAAFNKQVDGMNPADLEWATEWVVSEIWNRCFAPDPIPIHRDIYALLKGGKWKGIPFVPS